MGAPLPPPGDRPPINRSTIITEVEAGMAQQLMASSDEQLHGWMTQLQAEFYSASDVHHKAKDALKQVDAERALARDAFRAEQSCSDKHRMWKLKVRWRCGGVWGGGRGWGFRGTAARCVRCCCGCCRLQWVASLPT